MHKPIYERRYSQASLGGSWKAVYENVTGELPGETNLIPWIVVLLWLRQFHFHPSMDVY